MRKSAQIQLSVPKPCSQNWEEMSVNDKGRFCDNCNKSVIDFTHYSDQQLIDFLNNSSGEICGNLRYDQLEKPLQSIHYSNNRSVPQVLISAAFVIGLGDNVYAEKKQASPTIVINAASEKNEEHKVGVTSSGDSTHCITGTVTDKRTKEMIPWVTVLLEGTPTATTTDTNGCFKLDVPDYLQKDTIKLIISAVGYESQTLKFTPLNFKVNTTVELSADQYPMMRGALAYHSYQKPSLWKRMKYFFRARLR
jgi:hypothetical protein